MCIKKKVECVDGCVIVTLSHVNETVVQRIKSTLRYAYGVAVHVRKVGRQFILRVAYRRGKECVFDTIERFAEVVRNVCEYTIHSPRLPATP